MMHNLEIQLDSRYAIPKGIQFRYEDFGGIVYRRRDDKLFFLSSRIAMDLLIMANSGTVGEIINMMEKSNQPQDKIKEKVLKVLNSLRERGIIYELAR
ncbi:MAG: mycofactocin biosynthesis chaperone MftB [Syntrophomonas sp.]